MPRSGRQQLQPSGSGRPSAKERALLYRSECLALYGSEVAARERWWAVGHQLPASHPLQLFGDEAAQRRFRRACAPRRQAKIDGRQLAGEAHRHAARVARDGQALMPPGPPPACCTEPWVPVE